MKIKDKARLRRTIEGQELNRNHIFFYQDGRWEILYMRSDAELANLRVLPMAQLAALNKQELTKLFDMIENSPLNLWFR
jgi:hypothetical protein